MRFTIIVNTSWATYSVIEWHTNPSPENISEAFAPATPPKLPTQFWKLMTSVTDVAQMSHFWTIDFLWPFSICIKVRVWEPDNLLNAVYGPPLKNIQGKDRISYCNLSESQRRHAIEQLRPEQRLGVSWLDLERKKRKGKNGSIKNSIARRKENKHFNLRLVERS